MKRFICAMLTLIMLVGMVPMTAANAASAKTSGAAITVLKTMSSYREECYQVADTKEFRIGYGTVCEEEHTFNKKGQWDGKSHSIKEAIADERLREQLKEMEKKVNDFASSNSLSLKQNQFDALVVFSHLNGVAWMSGNGVVKTAIKNKVGAPDLLNALNAVSHYENYGDRNKVIVNMYCNNVYSDAIPNNYGVVTYEAMGGHIPESGGQSYTKWFDTSVKSTHPVPTKNGYKFLGWYVRNVKTDDKDIGGRVAYLISGCEGKILQAMWQPNDATYANASAKNPAVKYTWTKSSLASTTIYDKPDRTEGKEIGKVEGNVTVYCDFLGTDGSRWGRISGSEQWVLISAGSNGTASTSAIGVTVTNDYVNSRKNADIHSAKNGSHSKGTKLYILTTKNADGFLWGQVARSKEDHTPVGWVALMYTNWNSVKDDNGSSSDNGGSTASNVVATAFITFNGYVNVRSGAGTGYPVVGSLAKAETVNVYEIKTVNGHRWGRTDAGWFCLTYANVSMTGNDPVNNDKVSNEGALAYTFSGKLVADADSYVNTNVNTDKTKYQPKAGTPVTIYNMAISRANGTGSKGKTWAKIGWRVDTDGKNGPDTTVYGWVELPGTSAQAREAFSAVLSTSSAPIQMDTAKFTTVTDSVSVRESASSGAKATFKLEKGVEVKISAIELVGEDIWGYQIDEVSTDGRATGWVNLSSKYFSRNNLPTDPSKPSSTGKVATVINTDTVNVRKSASRDGLKIGSLSRGTTANVLEIVGDWYNLDIDVDKNPKTGSWVYKDYLDVKDGTTGNGGSDNSGAAKPVTTGTGIVANTYGGVNVRQGAGTAYAAVGKLLPGTQVEILEMKTVGSTKWGRMNKGWVCMDYITMLTEDTTYPGVTDPDNSGNGTPVGSYEEIDKTTTTAVYTGHIKSASTLVYATTDHQGKEKADKDPTFAVTTLDNGAPVTIYELIAVTERIDVTVDDDKKGDDDGHGSTTETVITTYWARTNDGYIYNPQDNIQLDALDEKVHTVTGVKTLNVRADATVNSTEVGELKQGDQVKVTALEIEKDKVWGRIEFEGEDRWIRLDYTSEGAYYVPEQPTTPPVAPPAPPVIGDNGNTGDGGYVNNSGYRYTGKVVNTNSVNVRATASTTASITTTLKSGAALVIYETTISENMAWGRCDAGWVYLYYVDMTPCIEGAIDARVVYQDNTIIYSDANKSSTVGTYGRMSVIDIYEIVGKMARTDLGWVDTDNLL